MTPEQFVKEYEAALGTQDWAQVEPLLHENACVTFSSGAVHRGKEAVGRAFTGNFEGISDEVYKISNVHWVRADAVYAVYLFDFEWSGTIDGKPASGAGRGTSVLVSCQDGWKLLVEHLGPRG
jgi:ketosteroid isomerase-like protein